MAPLPLGPSFLREEGREEKKEDEGKGREGKGLSLATPQGFLNCFNFSHIFYLKLSSIHFIYKRLRSILSPLFKSITLTISKYCHYIVNTYT